MVAIPLLVETAGADRFDRVLVVDCDPELQLARLMARDGSTREEAQRILAAQASRPPRARGGARAGSPREEAQRILAAQASRPSRLAVASDVVHNDGDLAQLRDQVEKLHR